MNKSKYTMNICTFFNVMREKEIKLHSCSNSKLIYDNYKGLTYWFTIPGIISNIPNNNNAKMILTLNVKGIQCVCFDIKKENSFPPHSPLDKITYFWPSKTAFSKNTWLFFYFCKNTPSDVVNQLRQETKMFIFSLASLTMKHESDFLWEAMLNLINLT